MKFAGRLAVLFLWAAASAHAAVTASVDRSRITLADSLVLKLRATGGEDLEKIDLHKLLTDFEVANTRTSSQFSIINGKSERSKELSAVLLPRRSGSLVIPSLNIEGQRTREIAVLVTDAPAGIDAGKDVFVEAEVDREAVYVQSQLIHTFRIYQAIELDDLNRSKLEINDAVVEELDSTTFQRTVEGRTYRVIEVKHAIFPQLSGELEIPSITFNARRLLPTRSLFNIRSGEPVRRRSQPIKVRVKPVPASWPDAPWVPADLLNLEESWSTLPEELEVGDSVTRTLTLTARGVDASQLPRIDQEEVPGIKVYPDKPRSENRPGNNGITAIGTSSAALLITEPGNFKLPAIRIPWWDTQSDQLRYAEVPARTISVAGAAPAPAPVNATAPASAPAAAAPTAVQTGVSLWLWTTVAALLGWLGTTTWLLMRQRKAPAPTADSGWQATEASRFKALLRACDLGQANAARGALQQWANSFLGTSTLPTLAEIATRFGDEPLAQALEELDRSLYAGAARDWDGKPLAAALKACRQQGRQAPGRGAALPPLYAGGP